MSIAAKRAAVAVVQHPSQVSPANGPTAQLRDKMPKISAHLAVLESTGTRAGMPYRCVLPGPKIKCYSI
jgi:hypothetical protein